MKQHTTNYFDTFIEVAEDTKVTIGTTPPEKDKPTVAEMQYRLISANPYKYSSDDILLMVYAEKNNITKEVLEQARVEFFSKGQACLRASPLTKSYGFGIHSNNKGKIALYAMESEEYKNFLNDKAVKKVKAMRSSRK